MTAFQEPLEKGWLRTVLNEVRQEVNRWPTSTQANRPSETREDSTHREPTVALPAE